MNRRVVDFFERKLFVTVDEMCVVFQSQNGTKIKKIQTKDSTVLCLRLFVPDWRDFRT